MMLKINLKKGFAMKKIYTLLAFSCLLSVAYSCCSLNNQDAWELKQAFSLTTISSQDPNYVSRSHRPPEEELVNQMETMTVSVESHQEVAQPLPDKVQQDFLTRTRPTKNNSTNPITTRCPGSCFTKPTQNTRSHPREDLEAKEFLKNRLQAAYRARQERTPRPGEEA
jgi:hypothetical protein